MPSETAVRIVQELAAAGYNADREAITLLEHAADCEVALQQTVETIPDETVVITVDDVRPVIEQLRRNGHSTATKAAAEPAPGTDDQSTAGQSPAAAVETMGSTTASNQAKGSVSGGANAGEADSASSSPATASVAGEDDAVTTGAVTVTDDVVSTGTGEYDQFVSVFRDRYQKLASLLRGRVRHRPTSAMADLSSGSSTALIGMVTDVHSTKNGHTRLVLEDTNGTFPCLIMKDSDVADEARTILHDEVIAIEGQLSRRNDDDEGIIFVDDLYFPDVARTYSPSTADRHVEAALISDVHVGSQEFHEAAWDRFTDWLHTPAAEAVEYLLIAGDMVEGVGVYPNQDEELDIIDIYDQYEAFSEYLKAVPGDLEIVLIPGNHDAVRLAEPQPAFDDELRSIMRAHEARIGPNPSLVTLEGVSILMYHGISLDELIAELPEEYASYDEPHRAMAQLLRKRHLAPRYGGRTRIAPEESDHLVIDEVPDVFHTGHVHKLGYGRYHNVMTINSSCWQTQTDFQKSVNLDPDVGFAPILDLESLELTIRSFA